MGSAVRRRKRWLAALVLLGLIYLVVSLIDLYRGPLRHRPLQVGHNAVWLAHRFFDDRDRNKVSGLELRELAGRVKEHNLEYLFVHVGPLDSQGAIPSYRSEHFQRVKSQVPGTRWLAWVGGLNADFEGRAQDTVDLTLPETRTGIARTVRELYAAGFDGIHYDIEPVRDGDRSFLALLDETPRDGILSVATPHMRPPGAWPVPPFERMWTAGYYGEVSRRCDQVVYMGYDSAQPSAEAYARWMRWQVLSLKACLESQELLIGVPTYDEESTLVHNPQAETLAAALWGISSAGPVDGVALYAHWTTTPSEWDTLAGFRGK
jgi:hypothetical protein